VTSETANLMIALRDGARGHRALRVESDFQRRMNAAASLIAISIFPRLPSRAEDNNTYYEHLKAALEHKPQFTMDDGCDLVTMLLTSGKDLCRT